MSNRAQAAYDAAMREMVVVTQPIAQVVAEQRTDWAALTRVERQAYSPLRPGAPHGSYLEEARR